ncbi:MAG: amidohydrolase [Dehalococcoidia bacterium]|nr:amidohydrolase [Dehalococcoidia bacterium]
MPSPSPQRIAVVDPWVNLHLPHHAELIRVSPEYQAIARQFGRLDEMQRGYSVEAMIAEMDRAGVEKAVLTTYGAEFPEYPTVRQPSAEEVLEIAAQHPQRFIAAAGFNSVRALRNPRGIMDAVRRLEGWAKHGRLRVLKVVPFATQIPYNDNLLYPLYAKCAELNIAVTINVGIAGPLYGSIACQDPRYLEELCLDFPDLKIVAAHMGHPWESLLIRLMEKFANLYLMTSAYSPKHIAPEVIQYMNTRGSHKVMFSADWPLAGFDRFIEQALALPFRSEDILRRYLRDNALAVFDWR